MESRIAFDTQLMDSLKSKGSFYSNPFTFDNECKYNVETTQM